MPGRQRLAMNMQNNVKIHDLIDVGDPGIVFSEVRHIINLMAPAYDAADIARVFDDTVRLFTGAFPGYRASNTKYHDLEHTSAVVLAAARLMHGCALAGMTFDSKRIFLGMTAAAFHDVGLIQTTDDREGSGAKYTIGHEQRSIDFMQRYFRDRNVTFRDMQDCSHLILCSNLALPPQSIPFRNRDVMWLGNIVGSADLLAQMADRNYLEKLLLLYQEFREARLPGLTSEFDLLKNTEKFYDQVVKKRLQHDFGNVSRHMPKHFLHRWEVGEDLYRTGIEKNIAYLRHILKSSTSAKSSYRKKLRRRGIADGLAAD